MYACYASPPTALIFCFCLPSPSSSFSFILTPLPAPPFRALAECSNLAGCFFSTPSPFTPFGFSECITNCPVSNTCTRIMPNSYLSHSTPKAIHLQKASLTKTAIRFPRARARAGGRAHRHTLAQIPHPFFSVTFAQTTPTCFNKCLKALFGECQGAVGSC